MKPVLVRPGIIVTVLFLTGLTLLTAVFLLDHPIPGYAQSTITFKNEDGIPINGTVRVLCFSSSTAAAPLADVELSVTDGQPTSGSSLPSGCTHLAALHLRHEQPANKREGAAYRIYTTSWEPGSNTPVPAEGDILINDNWPLTLVDLVASLAWEPAPTSQIPTSSVKQGLIEMAIELFDWTEGRMLFGDITVHTNGKQWEEADFRFLPANDKRPSAFVGGIIDPDVMSDTGPQWVPGMVFMGRLWDGRDAYDERAGRWTTPNAARTLAHEWAHYGLFLYDEYQATDGRTDYCICAMLPGGCGFAERDGSVMAYHYTASEFWHKDTHGTVSNFCFDTWQYQVHGETDWDTLTQWHALQELSLPFAPFPFPNPILDAGPSLGLARHLLDRSVGERRLFLPLTSGGTGSLPDTPLEPVVFVALDGPLAPTHPLPSQVYLLEGGGITTTRILPQGRPFGDADANLLGSLRLLGVQPDDTVRAYVDLPAIGVAASARYATILETPATNDVYVSPNLWDVAVKHHFEVENRRPTKLTIAMDDGDGRLSSPIVQLCSLDADVGCHPDWRQPMVRDGIWTAVFTPLPDQEELPRYLVARILDGAGFAVADELIFWLQMAGGVGPSHIDGMAPLLDDVVMVNSQNSLENMGDCNVVSYAPVHDARAMESPLPAGFGGLLGIPLQLQITLSNNGCPDLVLGQNNPLPVDLLLNLGYSQDEVNRLGLNEQTQLEILHYGAFGWTTVQQIGVNDDLNWITASILEEGIYAIGWLP